MMKVRDAISDVLNLMTIVDMVAMSEAGNVTPMFTARSAAPGRKRRSLEPRTSKARR
jgi:hypothetical protein